MLTCHARKDACGFGKRTIASTKTADTSLTSIFKGRRIFSAKAKIVVRVK